MSEPMDRLLQLVAEGRLTAEEAAPILAALDGRRGRATDAPVGGTSQPAPVRPSIGGPRFARIEVRESGRRVVDLRVPISLGRFALARIPGLSPEQIADVEAAVARGAEGPLLDVEDEDGDGVRIALE
jgi:SHOCT-like domain